ncbi:MAG: tRNA (guanosine(37)-N1)-methyltransferase TrmD [Planctomycetota bacterium]|jgi:tRNA (guanine37-N1)-methyltransferase|nr:tRNA (guanosine(37)-N1)-methyltransferase TrmD [Planctomycetota bacterium]
MPLRLDVLTLFPAVFSGFLSESIPRIAREKGAAEVFLHNIRDWSADRHAKVDDRPFGGGPGMVMACQPLVDAAEAVQRLDARPGRLIFLTPEGRRFNQPLAAELSRAPRLILVCGRYEGFDERVFDILEPERLSLGDFILSGGETAAMAVMDALFRLLPGVLGCAGSPEADSFSDGLLDYPHYTQPPEYRGLAVPEVLRSGNHARIDAWRRERSRERTRRFRPDLGEGRDSHVDCGG